MTFWPEIEHFSGETKAYCTKDYQATLYNTASNKRQCQFTPKVCVCCILYGWSMTAKNLPDCYRTAILVFKLSDFIRRFLRF